jgi:hypothetical protein
MKKKFSFTLLALLLVVGAGIGLYNLLYQSVEGTVGFKAISASRANFATVVMVQSYSPARPIISINDTHFRSDFPTAGNATVDQTLATKLLQRYTTVRYVIGLNLEIEERLHAVHIGEGLAYDVSRTNFNLVNAGDRIQCRVSRWESLSNIKLLGPNK